MAIDSAEAGDNRILEAGGFLILVQFARVGGCARKAEDIDALHPGIHFFERACFHERMNSFSRANLEMISTVLADLEVFIELPVIQHYGALLAFGPDPFRNLAF